MQAPKSSTVFTDIPNLFAAAALPAEVSNYAIAQISQAYDMLEESLDRAFIDMYITQEYRTYLDTTFRKSADGADTDSYEHAKQFVADMDKSVSTDVVPTNIFEDLEGNLESVERVATGVEFLDIILNGGTIDGESIGILAPSGGGKSTVANMILAACVRRKVHCWYFSTEQKLKCP